MELMQEFNKSLDKRISSINNSIQKANILTSLDPVAILLDENNVYDLTQEDANIIISSLKGESKLIEEEKDFLLSFAGLPEEFKKIKKELLGMSEEQKMIFRNIKMKIQLAQKELPNYNIEKLQKELNKYKELLSKLGTNDAVLITEIDLISQLLEKDEFSTEKQIEIYEKINEINFKIYANFMNITPEEIILDESYLIETNLDPELINNLFKEFGINWEKDLSLLDDEDKENVEKEIEEYKNKLIKYGDYDKIREILYFLKINNLEFLYDSPIHLTNTLLYSDKDKIEHLIKKMQNERLNYIEVLKKRQEFFYPPIRKITKRKKTKKGSNKPSDDSTTGKMDYLLGNIELLNKKGFPVDEIYDKNETFFIRKYQTQEKVFDILTKYGILFRYPNNNIKYAFSVLDTLDVATRLDIGIECGCYDYYQDNLTKLSTNEINIYKIKLARSLGVSEDEIFSMRYNNQKDGQKKVIKDSFKKNDKFGHSIKETFEIYKNVNKKEYIDYNNLQLYNMIVNNSRNDKITEISLNDLFIEQLDSNFKHNELIYNFDGVIISRLKVLRIYQSLISSSSIMPSAEVLLYSITKYSMLNEEEIFKIQKCLKSIKYKGRELK